MSNTLREAKMPSLKDKFEAEEAARVQAAEPKKVEKAVKKVVKKKK